MNRKRDKKGRFLEKFHISRERLKKLYWDEKKNTCEIAKIYRICSESVRKRMIKYSIPRRSKSEISKMWRRKYGYLIKPNFSKFKILAYILGVIEGDGSCFKTVNNMYVISLSVTSQKFRDAFYEALKEIGLNPNKNEFEKMERKKIYVTWAYSILFYEWYKKLGFNDKKRIAMKYPKDFLRGFYESEGHIKHSGNSIKLLISNQDIRLLNLAKSLLRRIGYEATYVKSQGKKVGLYILGSSDDKRDLLSQINPCIRNK